MSGSRALGLLGLSAIIGLATGVVTQLLQGLLPDGWSQAANAISPWLLVAFLVGSRMPDRTWAAIAGVVVLLFALVGFYGMTSLRFGIGGGTGSWLFWGIGSLVGGTVFGLAGFEWRAGPHVRRALAIGLLAAVTIAEGLYHLRIEAGPGVGVGFVIVGLLIPLVAGRSQRDRLGGYVAIVPALLLGAVGFVVFQRLYDVVSGVQ